MRECSCFFTGHRAIAASDINMVRRALSCAVLDMINRGTRCFIAGGAVGFDMLAAEAVADLKCDYQDIKLKLYLPCKGYNRKWESENIARIERLISIADEVRYISPRYSIGCMRARNRAMAADAAFCIAWHCHGGRSGTAQTVSIAKKLDCSIRNIAKEPW